MGRNFVVSSVVCTFLTQILLFQTSTSVGHQAQPGGGGGGNKAKMWSGKMKVFLKKYFWEGQKLTDKQTKALENLDPDASFAERLMVQHRRLVS